ncbi:MAG: BBP7 family outer membrane beta-barrel protein, partial [Fimbriiglobus sp.]|nr:BBP7 family outer membrane beta-barrel protein [Fimbriiglobus sp.]
MLRAALVLLLFIPLAIAQPPREEFPPPSALPRTSEELANGKTISRPLQPTARQLHNSSHADWLFQTDGGLFDPDPTNFPLSAAIPFQTWLSADLSLAWASRSSLPPLATSNLLAAPTLNHPATTVVLGNGKTPVRNLGGGRFTAGWWADGERTLGLETTFHVLGTATESERVNGGGAGNPLLARPLFNSRTGEEDVVYIAHPRMLGALTVSQSLRVQGWDATALLNLLSGDGWFVHAIGGYRYFQANEGLRFDQTSEFYRQLPDQPATAAYRTSAADQIDAHNR